MSQSLCVQFLDCTSFIYKNHCLIFCVYMFIINGGFLYVVWLVRKRRSVQMKKESKGLIDEPLANVTVVFEYFPVVSILSSMDF